MSDSDSPLYPRHAELTNPGPLVGLPAEPAEVGGPDAADLEVAALRAEVAKQHARADDWRALCHAANKKLESLRGILNDWIGPCEHGRDPWARCGACVERGVAVSIRAAGEAAQRKLADFERRMGPKLDELEATIFASRQCDACQASCRLHWGTSNHALQQIYDIRALVKP